MCAACMRIVVQRLASWKYACVHCRCGYPGILPMQTISCIDHIETLSTLKPGYTSFLRRNERVGELHLPLNGVYSLQLCFQDSFPEKLHPLFNRLERLLSWLSSRLPEHHLRLQAPCRWDAVHSLEASVDQGIVMLEVDAHAFCFEGAPEGVLGHAIGLLGP